MTGEELVKRAREPMTTPIDEPQKENDVEQERDRWIETARQYAVNADYWRDRALKAERGIVARIRRLILR